MNKRILTIIALMIVFLPIVNAQPLLKARIISYEPIPASPGEKVKIWIQLSNEGDTETGRVAIEVMNNSIFKIYNDESLKVFNSIQPYNNIIVSYNLIVSRDAIEGTNYLRVRYTSDYEQGTWIDTQLPIEVVRNEPSLSIKDIEITPKEVKQGERFDVSIELMNKGSSLLKDIKAAINVQDKMICSNQQCELVKSPFYPLTTTNIIEPSIKPSRSKKIHYELLIDPETESGVYRLPLIITFYDEKGEQHEISEEISIIVKNTPETILSIDSIEKNELTITISNTGLEPIKALRIENITIEGGELIKPKGEYYIGNIDTDDDAVFKISYVPKKREEKITITYTYMDSMNKEYIEEKTLTIENNEERSNTAIYIAIVVIVILLIVLLRRKKK